MAVYLSLVVISILMMCSYTNFKTGEITVIKLKSATRVYFFLVIILIIVQAIRADTVGGDLLYYKRSFFELGNMKWSDLWHLVIKYETGYVFLNKLVYLVTNGSFQWLLVIVAIIYNITLYKFIYKYSDNCFISIFLAICLGLLNFSMNNLRSSLALSIVYFSLPFLIEKKYVKFLLSIFIASMFHLTVICFILPLVICMISNKKICGVILTGVFVFFSAGFGFFSQIILRFSPRFSLYLGSTNGGGFFLFTFLIAVALMIVFISNKELWQENINVVMFKILLCAICFQCVALRISYFARAVAYNYVSMLILLPAMIKHMKIKKTVENRIIVLLIVVVMFSLFYYLSLQQDSTETLLYKVFWKN